jgi:HEAT repeat protein
MGKREAYVEQLKSVPDWEAFLKKHSGLPGPRGNLELAQAAADCGTARQFREWLKYDARRAPTNTPGEFVAFCGVLGHGRLLAEGGDQAVTILRRAASDPRWRVREAAAMGLQRLGAADMAKMLRVVEPWARGTPLEQRTAAAAGCEPVLLREPKHARRVLRMLDRITVSLARAQDRRTEEFRVLRQGLGYCWSVAIAALPEAGKPLLEKWAESRDPDVLWVVRENLGKARLARIEKRWVNALRSRMLPRDPVGAASVARPTSTGKT